MMSYLYITDVDGNNLAVDATISDTRNFAAKITNRPIEDGTSISDSIILENPEFTIEGIITNTPTVIAQDSDVTVDPDFRFLKNVGDFFNLNTSEYEKIKVSEVKINDTPPVLKAYQFLQNLYKGKKLFSLQFSGFDQIDDLVVSNLKYVFTSETGEALHFYLDIKQVQLTSGQKTTVPKNKAQNKVVDKKQMGTQPTKEVKKDDPIISSASKLFGVGE
jgi:hypothetical protein